MKTNIKLALKVLGRRKFFTFISLFGITLTLVVLMVATAMLDDLFTPEKPESRFDRVLTVSRVQAVGPHSRMSMNAGYAFLRDYVFTIPDIELASAFTNASTRAIYRGTTRIEAVLKHTDANYWKILDFRFVEGRPFDAAEESRGARVAVMTEAMRQKLFDGQSAVGRTFDIGGDQYRVIGVVPNVSATRTAAWSEIWVPVTTLKSSEWRHELMGSFTGMVLARDRSDFPRLARELESRLKNVPLPDPKEFKEFRSSLDTRFESVARGIASGPGLGKFQRNATIVLQVLLFTAAVFFMTLPALNLVTLNLSRILERVSEIGVRKAFGAPRSALLSQFVLENVVLTVIGGVCAFLLSIAALAAINAAGIVSDAHFTANWRVFLYGIAIAIFFGAFSGLYPAWRMSRLHPVNALRGGAQ